MTTIVGNEDPFEEVERGLDWLERLEVIRARQDREAAIRETVEYVETLRRVLVDLSGGGAPEGIAERYGKDVVELVESIGGDGANDPWVAYLRPTLVEE